MCDCAARLTAVETAVNDMQTEMAKASTLLSQIKDAVGPMIEKFEKSPIIKMLGV